MSAEGHQGINILLPGARVAVFSTDEETKASAQSLKEDWRFARVEVDVFDGGVQAAIETYKSAKSPGLLIIQTEEINGSFTDLLGELSRYCDEGTSAIIIGPVNDVYLYRQLIDMGVSDYLVKPITPDVLSSVIAKALVARLGVSDSVLIALVGAKGGVGTSVLSQIAGHLCSKTLRQKTILMDAGGAWSPASVGLGFDPSASLHEVARAVTAGNEDTLKRMIQKVSDRLSVLATGADAMLEPSVSAEQYEAILDNVMVKYPVVIVDLSSASASVRKAVIARATRVITVSLPTVTSLRFCRGLLKEISDIRGGDMKRVSLVLNQSGINKTYEISRHDAEAAIEFDVSASLEYQQLPFSKNESDSAALVADKVCASIITAFLPILTLAVKVGEGADEEEKDKNQGFLGGFLNKITTK